MITKRGKKAISPVIATVILVSIVVVVGVIILIWSFSFRGEQITKTVGGTAVPIEQYCDRVSLSATYDGDDSTQIDNEGNVALSSINVIFESSGNKDSVSCSGASLATAASKTISLSNSCPGSGTPTAVIPVLMGENKDGVPTEYPCESQEFSL